MCNHGNSIDYEKLNNILKLFTSHDTTKSHSRHISKEQCKNVGLTIEDMEEDNKLQDLILTVHHAFMNTFSQSSAVKIIENHTGIAYIESMQN